MSTYELVRARRRLWSAGICLGCGMGGFVDGIVLHQILQWHNMLSSKLPPVDLFTMKVNMVWDGLFHAFTWLMTAAGVGLLFSAGRHRFVPPSGRVMIGGLLVGWGLFNFVEGLIDHQLLGLHHVHPGAHQVTWDIGFLGSGVALILLGVLFPRRSSNQRAAVIAGAVP